VSKVKIPKTLLMGAATAATQIEGGDYNNNWYQWSLEGKIADGGSSITACDHWNRVAEDVCLMKELSIETYRMSIEWSRIYPKKGQVSEEGINHYIDEIDLLLKHNIVPLITLHHFSSPIWIQDIGGWKNKETIGHFLNFVETVVTFLGDRVCEYGVINEPNVFANDTYMDGKYPGGENGNVFAFFKASKHLIMAHVESYQLIHKLRSEKGFKGETKVGVLNHMTHFELTTKNKLFNLTKKFIDHSFHEFYFKGMVEGILTFPYVKRRVAKKGIYADFIGVNYYTRNMISPSFDITTLFGEVHNTKGLTNENKTDLDWEIYPKGLSKVITRIYNQYHLPIYITENGIADAKDTLRKDYINKHLKEVVQLIDNGVDIQRYYYWSLLDNLEWNDGYGPRFGLIEVNYDTQVRTIRESGYRYKKIIVNREIDLD